MIIKFLKIIIYVHIKVLKLKTYFQMISFTILSKNSEISTYS